MGILVFLAICVALTYEEGLPGFISLVVSFWPFSLMLGAFGIFTGVFLIQLIAGWNLSDRMWAVLGKMMSVFIIVAVISMYAYIYIRNDLDPAYIIRMGPLMLLLLAPGFIICYPYLYSLVKPLTDEQVSDPRVQELDINLPYNEAFKRCQDAIDMIDATDYTQKKTSHPGSGTLSIDAFPRYYVGYPNRPTRITISLKKTDATIVTHATISAVTLQGLQRIPSGLNEGYVNRIAGYLLGKKLENENDTSPPAING
jgi:hypothetical protein